MSGNTLSGELTRRVKKYDSEEERQQAKLRSYEKYKAKKYYCEICNKTMSLYNYSDHIKTKLHLSNQKASLNHSLATTR